MEKGEVISKPDEFKHVYEASENKLLQAIAQVFKDKGFGAAAINQETKQVESDYLIQDDWRTKGIARVKKINWKECEIVLSVITEKKISKGWEMRRLLGKSQYDTFFDAIELQLYQEMYKVK
jgi:membrane-bound lytic murein transglycosylase B